MNADVKAIRRRHDTRAMMVVGSHERSQTESAASGHT